MRLMAIALKTGMRRELGRSFRLVRLAWALLAASLAAGLGIALEAPFEGMATLFGLTLIAGWLLTFLLGIRQRIVPFLASMHAGQGKTRGKRLPPTPSSLTSERPLALHFACHLAALALLAVALVADSPGIAAAAALTGAAGATGFGGFFLIVLRRMRRANAAGRSGAVRVA